MNKIITIGRQYGSGGREIGEKLSQKLGIPFYDKEILTAASRESGISEELFYQNDENNQGSLLYSLLMGNYSMGEGGKVYPDLPLNHKIFLAQFDAIKDIAQKGPCVIVGRCADYVLADRKDLVSVFICADMGFKIGRLKEYNPDISEKKLEERIRKSDKKRSSYYTYFTDKKWGFAANYDLCIKSSFTGTDAAADIIADYLQRT